MFRMGSVLACMDKIDAIPPIFHDSPFYFTWDFQFLATNFISLVANYTNPSLGLPSPIEQGVSEPFRGGAQAPRTLAIIRKHS